MGTSNQTLAEQSLATIPNRFAFLDIIDNAVSSHDHLSILLVDVVRFSEVSSSFGWKVGDIFLLKIAKRIQSLFAGKAQMGRISGDIFGLIITGKHTESELRNQYEYLIEHFKTPIMHEGHSFIADFNVGAISNRHGNRDTVLLLSRAEAALRQAKENRYENFHCLSLEDRNETGRSLALKADLTRAFKNDELELYFQPKVDLATLSITGAECLLRWNHPLDGVLFPGALIEAAESYNMMNELGYWTLNQAFKHAAEFDKQGLDLKLSVNMSPTQLYDVNFVSNLKKLSTKYDVPLDKIELELTEDVALSNSLMVKKQLTEARVAGCEIAVDDFGKGYSNLAYIRDLNLDCIKIDKTFVMELASNPVNRAIIQAAQVIGQAMDCSIVAEGIETHEQLNMLREIGVTEGQGYLFSQAIPALRFQELARKNSLATDVTLRKHASATR